MAENKTKPTDTNVEGFINAIENEQKRNDSFELIGLMKELTGHAPVLWGSSIIGFGQYHYKYASGREGDAAMTGFSPRKTALTVYIVEGFKPHAALMAKLGKYKTGSCCLYIKKLDDIDRGVLREMITRSVAYMREKYGCE